MFYVGYDIRRWAPDLVFNRVVSPINGLDEWASLGVVIAPISGVMGPYLILLITGFWGPPCTKTQTMHYCCWNKSGQPVSR